MKTAIVLALALFINSVAFAKTYYVTDKLSANLRSGEGNDYRITKLVTSGTRVELLSQRNGYSLIQLSDGTKGWILSRYLSEQTPAQIALDDLQRRFTALTHKNETMSQEIQTLRQQEQSLSLNNGRLISENTDLENELVQLRASALESESLYEENKNLTIRVQNLQVDNGKLMAENSAFKNNTLRDWFLLGAGTLVFGIILGLILPKLRRKKYSHSSWA